MPAADMEPLFPDLAVLQPRATETARKADEVGRHLHPDTLAAVTELLRTINCYYSNLIEGHDTHPVQIERALEGDLSASPGLRDLQIEARAHIEVQRAIEERLRQEPALNVCDTRFLCWIHGEFYGRLPADLRVVRSPDGRREEPVVPGALREFDVRIGNHFAPSPEELETLLARFADAYDSNRLGRDDASRARVLATIGAAHHRLLWIHPFGDGNGRVTRLMTDALLRRAEVGAHGLWTVSRGLARARVRYRAMLAAADEPRHDDYDGRGALSARALTAFSSFFLDVCDDQISYMGEMLAVNGLRDRFVAYCRAREVGAIPSPIERGSGRESRRGPGRPPVGFRPEATRLLRKLLAEGALPREEVEEVTGLGDRTARRLVSSLAAEGLITAETPRAALRLRFPAHAAPYVFPDLYGSLP